MVCHKHVDNVYLVKAYWQFSDKMLTSILDPWEGTCLKLLTDFLGYFMNSIYLVISLSLICQPCQNWQDSDKANSLNPFWLLCDKVLINTWKILSKKLVRNLSRYLSETSKDICQKLVNNFIKFLCQWFVINMSIWQCLPCHSILTI